MRDLDGNELGNDWDENNTSKNICINESDYAQGSYIENWR